MSDPATHTEIEDVLSSIRRLVAQTPASRGAQPGAPAATEAPRGDATDILPAGLSAVLSAGPSPVRESGKPADSTVSAAEASHVYAPLSTARPLAERIAASNRKPPADSVKSNDTAQPRASAPALVLTPSFRIPPEMAEGESAGSQEPLGASNSTPLKLIPDTGPDTGPVSEAGPDADTGAKPSAEPDTSPDPLAEQADRDAIAAAISRRLSELEAGVDENPQDWEPDGSEVVRDAPPVQWDDAEEIDVEDAFDIELARVSERVTSRVSAYVARRAGLAAEAALAAGTPAQDTDPADDDASDGLTFHSTRSRANLAETTPPEPIADAERASAATSPAEEARTAGPQTAEVPPLGTIAANLDVDPGPQWSGAVAAEADALAAAAVAELEQAELQRAEDVALAEAALADGFDNRSDADDSAEAEPELQTAQATQVSPAAPAIAEDALPPAQAGTTALALEDDALRGIVGEILRDELRGMLGEQITRNVRMLVRREIQRILAGREFD